MCIRDRTKVIPATDWSKLKPVVSNSALLNVNTQLAAYGLDPVTKQKFSNEDFGLTFAVRPVSAPGDEWLPMSEKVSQESKAGEEPTVEFLEKVFLKAMVAASVYFRDSPVYFTAKSQEAVTTGKWSKQVYFQLKVCADGPFAEAGIDVNPKENNCKVTQFVLVRDKKTYLPADDNVGDNVQQKSKPAGGYGYQDVANLAFNAGDPNWFAVNKGTRAFRQWLPDSHQMRMGVKKGISVQGKLSTSFEGKVYIATVAGGADFVSGDLTLFGYTFSPLQVNVPENFQATVGDFTFGHGDDIGNPPTEQVAQLSVLADGLKKVRTYGNSFGFPSGIPYAPSVSYGATATASLSFAVKKTTAPASASNCAGTYGNYCYRVVNTAQVHNHYAAYAACAAQGGKLPSDHGDPANAAALTNLVPKIGWFWKTMQTWDNSGYYYWGDGGFGFSGNHYAGYNQGAGFCGWAPDVGGISPQAAYGLPCHFNWGRAVCEFPLPPGAANEISKVHFGAKPFLNVTFGHNANFTLIPGVVRIESNSSVMLFTVVSPIETSVIWTAAGNSPSTSGNIFAANLQSINALSGHVFLLVRSAWPGCCNYDYWIGHPWSSSGSGYFHSVSTSFPAFAD